MSTEKNINDKLLQRGGLILSFIGLTFNTCIRLGHGQKLNIIRSGEIKYPQKEIEIIVEGGYWAIIENNKFVIDVNDKISSINYYIEKIENNLMLNSISIKNRNILLNYDKNISILVISDEEDNDVSDWYLSIDGSSVDQ
jgi:hypothetical protein